MRAGRLSLTEALILLVCALPAAAHELGTIRTRATFQRSGRYAVELIVDREHLTPGFGAWVRSCLVQQRSFAEQFLGRSTVVFT